MHLHNSPIGRSTSGARPYSVVSRKLAEASFFSLFCRGVKAKRLPVLTSEENVRGRENRKGRHNDRDTLVFLSNRTTAGNVVSFDGIIILQSSRSRHPGHR